MPVKKVQAIKESIMEQIQLSEDIVSKELHTNEKMIETLYIKSISDEKLFQECVINPFFEITSTNQFRSYLQSHPKITPYESEKQLINELLSGTVLLFYLNDVYLFDGKADLINSAKDTNAETTIQGPQSGFSESIPINLGLIRQRYPETSLNLENTMVGTISKTDVMIIYDSKKVDLEVLGKVKQFLSSIDVEMFQAGEQLLDIIKKNNRALFPVMLVSERPDRAAVNLAGGKIVLLISGSPYAVILPTVMKDFMVSMEDIYQTFWVGKFLLFLRYFGFFISIILPGLYVATTSYNPELFRVQLALSIAGSRSGIPYPSFIEVLLMLLMMELLTEASIRLPKAIGPTATTVGGLILGQAATDAGLVSNIMIIIVSAVAISNFVVPINNFGFAIRIIKYFILGTATLFGLVGVVLGLLITIGYLVKLDSFGKPFFALIEEPHPTNN